MNKEDFSQPIYQQLIHYGWSIISRKVAKKEG
jgi:hypothetical protein